LSSVKRKVVKTGRWTFEAKKEKDGGKIYMLKVTKYAGTPIDALISRITKTSVTHFFLKCNPGDNRALRELIVKCGKPKVKGFECITDTELVLVYHKDTIPDIQFYEAVSLNPKEAFEIVSNTQYKPKGLLTWAGYVEL